nr:MAG TPA: HNH endonuclease bacteriophage, HNH Endonuclease, DNA.52A [Caudoviricetes sp.]
MRRDPFRVTAPFFLPMDYKSKRWLALRARVLRRDKGLCREALRYGRRVEATTVHHVYPVEDYPELQWAEWNLISVSQQAHNSFHDRSTGKLTPAGLAWQKRVSPPRKSKTERTQITGLGDSFRRTENSGRG